METSHAGYTKDRHNGAIGGDRIACVNTREAFLFSVSEYTPVVFCVRSSSDPKKTFVVRNRRYLTSESLESKFEMANTACFGLCNIVTIVAIINVWMIFDVGTDIFCLIKYPDSFDKLGFPNSLNIFTTFYSIIFDYAEIHRSAVSNAIFVLSIMLSGFEIFAVIGMFLAIRRPVRPIWLKPAICFMDIFAILHVYGAIYLGSLAVFYTESLLALMADRLQDRITGKPAGVGELRSKLALVTTVMVTVLLVLALCYMKASDFLNRFYKMLREIRKREQQPTATQTEAPQQTATQRATQEIFVIEIQVDDTPPKYEDAIQEGPIEDASDPPKYEECGGSAVGKNQ